MRRGMVFVGAVALVVLGSVSVAAGAQAAKVSGPEKIFVTPSNSTSAKHPGKIVLTGTIAAYGNVVKVNAAGKPAKKGAYRKVELKKGTMLVDIAPFAAALAKAESKPTYDSATCSLSVTATGGITIVSGTKAYTGITGSFTVTAEFAEIGPLTKKGKCTTKTTTAPVATYSQVTGSGTVTLP